MVHNVTDSAFYMWRTLIAVAHADNIVTDEEIEFIARVMGDLNFSDEQTATLKDDIHTMKDVEAMFEGITDQKDRTLFFDLARDLVWADDDFSSEEQSVMISLYKKYMNETDIETLMGRTSLEFEEDSSTVDLGVEPERKGLRDIVMSFYHRFL